MSMKQWMGITLLCWGIFSSVSVYNRCVELLNQKAFSSLLLIATVAGFSTVLTMTLLVVLFVFVVRWHVLRRIDGLAG